MSSTISHHIFGPALVPTGLNRIQTRITEVVSDEERFALKPAMAVKVHVDHDCTGYAF